MSGAVFSYQWLANDAEITGATSDTYTLVEADFDKAVKVRVIFNDDDNNEETLTSEATAAVAAETAVPDAPQSLNVSPDDTGTLDVSWEAPASDGGSAITGYKVQWKRAADSWDTPADVFEATATGTTHTITGLTDGVEYAVRVIAVNDVGDGPPSDETTGTPRETTPPELSTATVDGATLTLTYDEALDENSEPSSDAFSVTVGGTDRAVDGVSVSGSSVILTLGSAVASGATVTVSYTVPTDAAAPRIQDEAGNPAASFSDQDVENKTPPPANSPATGVPSISGTVRVGETLTAETSAVADADGMSGAVFSYQWLANDAEITGATSDTYTLVEADFDKAVKVRVIFNDDDNNEETLTSEATAAVAAETAVPDAPQSLNVSPDDTGTLDVSWEAPASDGGSAITGYKVQWKRAADSWDTPADVFEATATGTTHTITGLTDGVEYAVRVIAVNDVGDGPPSDETTGTPRETTPPELSTATVDGATLTLTYDEALDENSEPSSDAFSVTVGGTDRAVDGVSVSGSSVILTLGSAVASGATVTVSYTVPTDAAAPRIQDEAGNPAASFSDQDVENKTPPPANSPATGVPSISGTVRVGETLTAETRDIEDDDGLDNAVFTYQWLANGADINGATSDTYTLVDDDAGLTIQVKVSFRDDKNNPETLTSAATAAVAPRPNSPATGAPSISGTVQVGETLTAETSAIADADGMSGAVFSYQWLADDADISGATSDTYTLVADDVGKAIKVKVSFRDDRNHQESLTSEATAAVTAAADDSSIWSATLTVGSSSSFHGYWNDLMGSLAPDGFNIDGSDYTVTSLSRYGDLMFAFVLDQALPGDFTLQVGDTTLRSEEADVITSSSSYSYQWQNKIPALSDGDIVEVSLTLAE